MINSQGMREFIFTVNPNYELRHYEYKAGAYLIHIPSNKYLGEFSYISLNSDFNGCMKIAEKFINDFEIIYNTPLYKAMREG